jgi:AcrR family transcriptional regulator
MKANILEKERPRGRPVETDQQDLKTQILDTAEAPFSDLGYAATSVRQIAENAGVNPALSAIRKSCYRKS